MKLATLPGLLGLELTPRGHVEKLVSALGGFVGILAVLLVSSKFVGGASVGLIVASMGASAVLLFAAPHGPLSQPWPLLGGHVLSAFAGVTCYRLIPDPVMASAASVGLAIGLMYYGRCIHPPGGATALTAVIGGQAVHAHGYWYLLTPVMLNVLILLTVAVALNYPLGWRRYPVFLVKRAAPTTPTPLALSHEHLTYALRQMGSLIDVAEEDLVEIYSLAQQHARGTHLPPDQIQVGRCYAHTTSGPVESVRQVLEVHPGEESLLTYRIVAGHGVHTTRTCTRGAFALWAAKEVPAPTE